MMKSRKKKSEGLAKRSAQHVKTSSRWLVKSTVRLNHRACLATGSGSSDGCDGGGG